MALDNISSEKYDPENKLKELGIELPRPPDPVANYVNGVRSGNLIFLAGKGPKRPDGSAFCLITINTVINCDR